MPGQSGAALFESPPHAVDIYLPDAPTFDSGGGTKLNWPATPSQEDAPCSINTSGASRQMRQGQNSITVGNRVAFYSAALTVTLTQGTKLIARDTGRTFIIQGLQGPGRAYGTIPAFTYCTCDEIL